MTDLQRYKQAKGLLEMLRVYWQADSDAQVVELGLGFNLNQRYAISGTINLRLDGWRGRSGGSGCTPLPMLDGFRAILLPYLNEHIEEILQDAAMRAIRTHRSAALAEASRLREEADGLEEEVSEEEESND